MEEAFKRLTRLHDVCDDAADAGAGQTDRAGGTRGQVEYAAADERAAVVDGDDDAAVAMGHLQFGTERQGTVGRGHGALIEALARGGPAAGFTTVIRSHPREAASGTRGGGEGGIGVAPGATERPCGRIAGVMG